MISDAPKGQLLDLVFGEEDKVRETDEFASLDAFDFHRSADVMLALVIGGAGWLWGGLVGALAFKVLHDLISALTVQYWTFWIGFFLVVLMLVGRQRLFKPWTWWRRKA